MKVENFLVAVSIFQAKEVFSFSQDDLVTEEILILDCVEELHIWVGHQSGVLSKEQALDIGKVLYYSNFLVISDLSK